MNWTEYDRLRKLAEADIKITTDNVLQKSIDRPIIYHKYLDIFIVQTRKYRKMKIDVNQMYGQLYKKYKFDGNIALSNKSEVEAFINNDEVYIKLLHSLNIQETIIIYLEKLLDTIKSMSFDIKNFIEFQKFLGGS